MRRIVVLLFLNMVFVILFSGCFSAMHPAQVTDGPNVTLAFRHFSDKIQIRQSGGWDLHMDLEAPFSIALRYGWAPSQKGMIGLSFGLLIEPNIAEDEDYDDLTDYLSSVGITCFAQGPKNRFIDYGAGVELPRLGIYSVISRDVTRWFTLYCEVRSSSVRAITPGVQFEIYKYFSIFTEVNIVTYEYDYWQRQRAAIITMGLSVHGAQ